MISLKILIRNWPVKYQNHLKKLKHINKVNVIMDSMPLLINNLKDAFFLLKINRKVLTMSVSILSKMFWSALQTLNLPISTIS